MSKKKNTLKDLDEFLKQQAATLVTPDRIVDKKETIVIPEYESTAPVSDAVTEVSTEKILADLQELAKKEGERFSLKLCDLIIRSVGARNTLAPEDKMLINTALYIKSGQQWKQVIREYWKQKHLKI